MILVLIGLMAYPFLKARRERLGEAAEPHDLPAGDARQPCRSQAPSCRRAAVSLPPLAPPRAWPVPQRATTESATKKPSRRHDGQQSARCLHRWRMRTLGALAALATQVDGAGPSHPTGNLAAGALRSRRGLQPGDLDAGT